MRTLVITIFATFAFVGSAFSSDIAIGADVTTNPSIPACGWSAYVDRVLKYFPASNAVDGSTATQWVAPGYIVQPYLLINLGQPFTDITSLTVTGLGNLGLTTSFDIFVSAAAPDLTSLATIESNSTLALSVLNQPDGGTGWSITTPVSASLPIQYVLYWATGSTFNCPAGGCSPGDGILTGQGQGIGQDDAFVGEIIVDPVDPVPEPATLGLISLTLLAIGFARRPRK